MTTPEPVAARSGIAYVLAATVVAGGFGYLIQIFVPLFISEGEYVAFSVYWSSVYLVVSAIAGVQQEVTRASHPRGPAGAAGHTLLRFAFGAGVGVALAVALTSFLWAPGAFGEYAVALIAALAAAATAYTLIAVMSGVFYGVRAWPAVAGMTVTDSALRLVAVGLTLGFGGGVVALGWAVSLPFAVAAVILWIVSGRRAVREVALDVPLRGLITHSASTVGASLATGVMISGLPLLLGTMARGIGESDLAALILVITLTRAPLVVPLLALQSYLVVTFRDAPGRAMARTLKWGGALLTATVALSAAGVLFGPWIVDVLYGDRFTLEPAVYAVVIASAGTTALLCLTGPAALAAGRHGSYVTGWAVSSAALVLVLALGPSSVWSVVSALALAPSAGVVVHLVATRAASARQMP